MRRGFTLVELLVTVSIIAILASIAIGAYNSFQKNGRDAKRQADLKVIQSALEQYKADQNYYPTTGSVVPGSSLTRSIGGSYLNKIPQAPSGSIEYSYFALPGQPTCDNSTGKLCTSYYLCAKVENSNNANTLTNCDSKNYNYEVSSP